MNNPSFQTSRYRKFTRSKRKNNVHIFKLLIPFFQFALFKFRVRKFEIAKMFILQFYQILMCLIFNFGGPNPLLGRTFFSANLVFGAYCTHLFSAFVVLFFILCAPKSIFRVFGPKKIIRVFAAPRTNTLQPAESRGEQHAEGGIRWMFVGANTSKMFVGANTQKSAAL